MPDVALSPNVPAMTVTPETHRYASGRSASIGADDVQREVSRFIAGTFFSTMMKAMRSTVPEDGLMSGGRGEEIFQEFFDRELGEQFAQSANFPQVEAAVRQLSGRAVYRRQMPGREGEPALRRETGVDTMPARTDGGEP